MGSSSSTRFHCLDEPLTFCWRFLILKSVAPSAPCPRGQKIESFFATKLRRHFLALLFLAVDIVAPWQAFLGTSLISIVERLSFRPWSRSETRH